MSCLRSGLKAMEWVKRQGVRYRKRCTGREAQYRQLHFMPQQLLMSSRKFHPLCNQIMLHLDSCVVSLSLLTSVSLPFSYSPLAELELCLFWYCWSHSPSNPFPRLPTSTSLSAPAALAPFPTPTPTRTWHNLARNLCVCVCVCWATEMSVAPGHVPWLLNPLSPLLPARSVNYCLAKLLTGTLTSLFRNLYP